MIFHQIDSKLARNILSYTCTHIYEIISIDSVVYVSNFFYFDYHYPIKYTIPTLADTCCSPTRIGVGEGPLAGWAKASRAMKGTGGGILANLSTTIDFTPITFTL
jgi:hypothetical protein